MKRILILAVILIIICGIACYYLCGTDPQETKINVHLVIFGKYQNLTEQSRTTIMEYLNSVKFYEAEEVNISVYTIDTLSGSKFNIKNNISFDPQAEMGKSVVKKINEVITNIKTETISNQETNSLISQLMIILDNLSQQKKEKHTVFLFGRLPICYKIDNLRNTNINSQLKGKNYSYMKIIWGLNTNDERPEKELYRSLVRKNFEIVNKPDLTPIPICPDTEPKEELSKVEFVLFSKLDKNLSFKVIERLKGITQAYKNLDLTLNTFSTSKSETYNWKNYSDLLSRLNGMMNNENTCDWHKSKFILKSLFEKYERRKDTVSIFLLGDIPDYKEELVFRLDKYKEQNNNLTVFMSLKPESFEQTLSNVFVNRFKYEILK